MSVTLTAEQDLAAAWTPTMGSATVVAGAGSGKTTLIVEIVTRLVGRGGPPIIVATFMSKVGVELRARLGSRGVMVGAQVAHVGTLHSLALKRRSRVEPGKWSTLRCVSLPAKERTPGVPHALTLWRRVVGGASRNVEEVESQVSYWRAHGLTREKTPAGCPAIIRRYLCEYLNLLDSNSAWDFDLCVEADLAAVPAGSDYTVIVDEAQDCNQVQFDYVRALAAKSAYLLVGDFRQSVYAFRGAVPGVFGKASTDLVCFPISQNFRSHRRIVAAANRLPFPGQLPMQPAHDAEGKLTITDPFENEEDEDNFIACSIKRLIEAGTPMTEIAVLGRTNARLVELRSTLEEMDIPVQMKASSLFDGREARALVAYLVLAHIDAGNSLIEVLNVPYRRIPTMDAEKHVRAGKRAGKDIFAILASCPGPKNEVANLSTLLRSLRSQSTWEEKVNMAATVILLRLKAEAAKKPAERGDTESSVGAVEAAARIAMRFSRHGADAFRRLADFVDRDRRHDPENRTAVTLSTVHSAKGLQWSVGFVLASLGQFPHVRGDPEEERRLFYVAVTRWKHELTITSTGATSPLSAVIGGTAG